MCDIFCCKINTVIVSLVTILHNIMFNMTTANGTFFHHVIVILLLVWLPYYIILCSI